MSEPLYEYVKGVGWTLYAKRVYTYTDGTRVYIEERLPKKGEYYRDIGIGSVADKMGGADWIVSRNIVGSMAHNDFLHHDGIKVFVITRV